MQSCFSASFHGSKNCVGKDKKYTFFQGGYKTCYWSTRSTIWTKPLSEEASGKRLKDVCVPAAQMSWNESMECTSHTYVPLLISAAAWDVVFSRLSIHIFYHLSWLYLGDRCHLQMEKLRLRNFNVSKAAKQGISANLSVSGMIIFSLIIDKDW